MNTPPSTAAPRTTILVVDDQESNVQVVGTLLDLLGFDIIPATSGEQALKRMSARRPDLVLLDVLMPGMNGIETCRRIHAQAEFANVPIIFLSAADDKNLVVEGLESGGVDYVTKPFSKAELLSRVRLHLALKQGQDALRGRAQEHDLLLGLISRDLKGQLDTLHESAQRLQAHAAMSEDETIRTLATEVSAASARVLSLVNKMIAQSPP